MNAKTTLTADMVALRELAEKALPHRKSWEPEKWKEFQYAANPSTIISLLSQISALQGEMEMLDYVMKHGRPVTWTAHLKYGYTDKALFDTPREAIRAAISAKRNGK